MFYRIRIDMAFDRLHPSTDIITRVLPHLPGAITINPGQPHEERGYIIVEKCYHDEDPTKPCEILAEHFTS